MKSKKLLKIGLIALAVLIFSFIYRIDYVLVKPGSIEELQNLIEVEGATGDDEGKLFMVTVAQQQATLLWAAYGFFHPHIEIQPLRDVLPPGMDQREYRQLLDQMMEESQIMSKFIALRRAGYEVEIIGEGAVVEGLMDVSASEGILQRGDIITSVDGDTASTANELITQVQARSVGDPVRLSVIRDEETLELEITTSPHPDDPELPALGIYIRTLSWDAVLPVDVRMETGQIGGPSAGLMFVLEILNQLNPEDITGGRLIAGTGTIDINENVGRIGGVFQKVIAAEDAGVEFFIVPEGNYDEAKKAVRWIELVPVATLQQAMDFLSTINREENDTSATLTWDLRSSAVPFLTRAAVGYYL